MDEVFKGKPLNQIHPALVHFPVGLWVLSLLFDLATLFFGANNLLVRGAFYAMVGGTAMAVVAAIPGLIDWAGIRADHPAKRTATTHMILNLTAVGLYAVNILLRWGELDEGQTPALPLVLSLVGIGIISVSGYLGGMLVYDDGIAVGRHRRDTERPRETVRRSSREAQGGFVVVADEGSLKEGETLRAEVDGNVMAIARVDGQVFAFQEFCTHRFGPLSEGAIHGHQIECPWHRSRFDMQTGKVAQGPAKVDLKMYDVEVKDGKIRVRVPEKSYPGERAAERNQ